MTPSGATRTASLALLLALGLPAPVSADEHPAAAGEWLEDDGPCPGGILAVSEAGGQVVSIQYEATCSGLRVAWTASNIRWVFDDVLAFDYRRTAGPADQWGDGSAHLVLSRAHGATLRWQSAAAGGLARLKRPDAPEEDEPAISCFCVK